MPLGNGSEVLIPQAQVQCEILRNPIGVLEVVRSVPLAINDVVGRREGDARWHARQELSKAHRIRISLVVDSIIGAQKLEIAARGLRFVMRETDGPNARARVHTVPAHDETEILVVVLYDAGVVIVTGPLSDRLDSQFSAVTQQARGHAGNRGNACETELGVQVRAWRCGQTIRARVRKPEAKFIDHTG